jgi:hypothetical protein
MQPHDSFTVKAALVAAILAFIRWLIASYTAS